MLALQNLCSILAPHSGLFYAYFSLCISCLFWRCHHATNFLVLSPAFVAFLCWLVFLCCNALLPGVALIWSLHGLIALSTFEEAAVSTRALISGCMNWLVALPHMRLSGAMPFGWLHCQTYASIPFLWTDYMCVFQGWVFACLA